MLVDRFLTLIISILLFLFIFVGFNGINVGYTSILYDQQRLLQIIILTLNTIFFIHSGIFYQIFFRLSFVLFLSLSFFLFFRMDYLLIVDILFYFMLMLLIINLSKYFNLHQIFKISIYFPIVNIAFLALSLIGFFFSYEIKDWHLNYSNIRLYDSALVPLIFYIFYYLSQLESRKKSILLSMLVVAYIVSLYFDGARAALGAIFIGLFLSLGLYWRDGDKKHIFKNIFLLMALSTVFYFLYVLFIYVFYGGIIQATVIRTTTSLRAEIWIYALQEWLKNPFLGNSGGSLLWLNDGKFSVLHPHNFIILWVTEYGVIGVLQVAFILYFLVQLFLNRNMLHPLLFAGVIAIWVDSLLSGSLIYPDTQMLNAIFLALVLAEISKNQKITQYNSKYTILFFKFWLLILVIVFLSIFMQDLKCYSCESTGIHAPRIWEYGQFLHLSKKE